MKCWYCSKDFPSEILSPVIASGFHAFRESTPSVCGICALEIRNHIHGLPKGTPFKGEVAQEMYSRAVEHLNNEETIDENTRGSGSG